MYHDAFAAAVSDLVLGLKITLIHIKLRLTKKDVKNIRTMLQCIPSAPYGIS